MIRRTAQGWELILADLALILFLVVLSALAVEADREDDAVPTMPSPQIAPAQALFRPDPDGPDIAQWLANQPFDPRATLTIFATHSADDREIIWRSAEALARAAEAEGYSVRVVIKAGQTNDLHASLAYDVAGESS